MKDLYELRNILYDYVKEYNGLVDTKDSLSNNISLSEEVLSLINDCLKGDYDDTLGLSLCLNSLYGNKYDELLTCIYASEKLYLLGMSDENNKSKILTFKEEIRKDYENKREQLDDVTLKLEYDKEKMISARRVISSLKYHQFISKNDIKNVSEILRKLGRTDTDLSLYVESLFVHNKKIAAKKSGHNIQDKYKFIDLLSLGYEKFEYPDVSNEEKLNKLASTILSVLNTEGITSVDYEMVLPIVGKNVNDIDEFEFVLIRVLEKLRSEIDDFIELIKSEEFMMDLDAKNQLSIDCYKLITKYNLVRNYMDSEIKKYVYIEKNEVIEEETDDLVNNVFYLCNGDKIFLLDDIKDFPSEYLGKVSELINDFKNNTISKKKNKRMTEFSLARGFLELKGDQIRIIYKKIKDNNYLIYGAFIKKDDRKYRRDFTKIISRNGLVSDNSVKIEEELVSYIDNNGRKWSR